MKAIEKKKKELSEFKNYYTTISAKMIHADPSYNRSINRHQVEDIIANFDPNLVNPVKVSYRDGRYNIFDGNHTLRALMEMSGNDGDLPVYAKVYEGMTKEDEARMFAKQNGTNRQVSTSYKLRALNVANDPEIVKFKEATISAGAKCDFNGSCAPYHIKCYDTAFKIFKKNGAAHYKTVVSVVIRAWNGHPDSLKREIICGVDILIREFKGLIDTGRLVSKLALENPNTIISKGKGDYTFSGNKRYAVQMGLIYNKKLSKTKQLNLGDMA